MATGADIDFWDALGESKNSQSAQLFGFGTDQEIEVARRRSYSWPHIRPNSVLVAIIGNKWREGCKDKVRAMVEEHEAQGFQCWVAEMVDSSSTFPSPDINGMHDRAVLMAKNAGLEWVNFVDCDTQPEPGTLLTLMNHNQSVIAPLISYDDTSITQPLLPANRGVLAAKWTAISFLLIRTSVFNSPNTNFFNCGHETMVFQQFWQYGHQLWVDTDVSVPVVQPPSCPKDLSFWDRMTKLENAYDEDKVLLEV
jgi:hypothetical protein